MESRDIKCSIHTIAILLTCSLASAYSPHQSIVNQETVGFVHDNYYYDDQGRQIFRQLIFESEYGGKIDQIRDWRLVKAPLHYYSQGGYHYFLVDYKDSFGVVRSRNHIRSYTQYDPEIREREDWPKKKRWLLFSTSESH